MLVDSTYEVGEITLRGARSEGDRRPLLLLHGVTRRWQTFLPMIPALATRWQVHAVDARGHGSSDRAAGGYAAAEYVPDVVSLVRDRIARPTAIYGHSLGAMVALAVAAELPELLRGIVLEDPPFETMGSRLASTSWLSFFRALQPLAGDRRPVAQVARELAEVQIGTPGERPVRLGDARDATSLRFTAVSAKKLDPRALDPIIEQRWLEGYDEERILRGIRCPVLMLQADSAAGGMLVDEDAERVEAAIADVTRIRFSGAGHVLHWQRTTEVLRHTLAFLESLDEG